MCMCVCTCVSLCVPCMYRLPVEVKGGHRIPSNLDHTHYEVPNVGAGNQSGSSAKTISAISHWALQPQAHTFEQLVPSWWCCLGWLWKLRETEAYLRKHITGHGTWVFTTQAYVCALLTGCRCTGTMEPLFLPSCLSCLLLCPPHHNGSWTKSTSFALMGAFYPSNEKVTKTFE